MGFNSKYQVTYILLVDTYRICYVLEYHLLVLRTVLVHVPGTVNPIDPYLPFESLSASIRQRTIIIFKCIFLRSTGELIYWTQYSWTFSGPKFLIGREPSHDVKTSEQPFWTSSLFEGLIHPPF